MSIEKTILISSWIIIAILLWKFVPLNRIREAQLVFFFKQFLTWFFGLAVVEARLLEYPVRFFSYASRASFTFEYVVYPSICALFNLHFPQNKSITRKVLYYIYYSSTITIIEVILEVYTDLIKYTGWTWYYTWITLTLTFFASRKYYLWFFRKTNSI